MTGGSHESSRPAEQTADGPNVIAYLDMSQIVPLAQFEGIRDINESLPMQALGEENAWDVIAGTYAIGQKPSLYLAGVTGAGTSLTSARPRPGNARRAEPHGLY